MLSRVADSIYWLGRYLERAENYARFINVNINLSLDLPPGMKEQWKPLIAATGDLDYYITLYGNDFSRENAIRFLAFDTRNQNSMISTVSAARENARTIRESISKETWEVLNELYFKVKALNSNDVWQDDGQVGCFKAVQYQLQLISGIAANTMPRNQGWYFSELGQYIERADKTSRILDVKYHFLLPSPDDVGSPLDFLHWAALLKSVSGFNVYRRTHGKLSPRNIVKYLVLDRYFPRSILFCLMSLEDCLHEISGSKKGFSNSAEKAIGNLRADLEYAEIGDIFDHGLHEYLDNLQAKLNDISRLIYERYFQAPTGSNTLSKEQ
ncbi:MAG: alpha-E domain-containing protein [Cyclobacteriaceae bacterium]